MFSFFRKKPRVKKGGIVQPELVKRTKTGETVSDSSVNRVNTDLTTLRWGADTKSVVREYMKVHPDMSHASNSLMRFIITDRFTAYAKDLQTGQIDSEATRAVQSFVMRLNSLPPAFDGYYPDTSLNGVAETLCMQLFGNGCAMAELVLDRALLPSSIESISTNNLKYRRKGGREVPYIEVQGVGEVDLDFPTVRSVVLNQDPEKAYADSFYEAAVQAVVASEEFRNDMRRAFRKASLPRVEANIDTKAFLDSLSVEERLDRKKLSEAMSAAITAVDKQLSGLQPEDAVVHFDSVDIKHLSMGNVSTHKSSEVQADIINSLVSSGLKTLPAIIGRALTQNAASTEAVLFLKMAENIQTRLNSLFSSLLTIAVRLHGFDVVVKTGFVKPNLRPDLELEAFYAMKQSRIAEQWSWGLISDEEASIELTGDLPSGNFSPMSGTRFRDGTVLSTDNPYSNTSVGGKQTNTTPVQRTAGASRKKPKKNRTA